MKACKPKVNRVPYEIIGALGRKSILADARKDGDLSGSDRRLCGSNEQYTVNHRLTAHISINRQLTDGTDLWESRRKVHNALHQCARCRLLVERANLPLLDALRSTCIHAPYLSRELR
jgi:hypothetical protein